MQLQKAAAQVTSTQVDFLRFGFSAGVSLSWKNWLEMLNILWWTSGICLGFLFPTNCHPAGLASQLLGNCRGMANRSFARLVHTSYCSLTRWFVFHGAELHLQFSHPHLHYCKEFTTLQLLQIPLSPKEEKLNMGQSCLQGLLRHFKHTFLSVRWPQHPLCSCDHQDEILNYWF